jgi:GNAT superfamily N-acetyltransferase
VPADHAARDIVFGVVGPGEARRPELREELLDMWVKVTDAGGAVGFTPPADVQAIASALDERLDRIAAGTDVLGVLRRDGEVVGMGFLVNGDSALRLHWRTVMKLMVRPELQGLGAGRLLLEGLHRAAGDIGLEHLQLTVRGGTGVESFYQRLGYTVVGQHPGAIRVEPGDDRDEIMLVARL